MSEKAKAWWVGGDLNHSRTEDFWHCRWLRSPRPLPLLVLRFSLLAWSLALITWSMATFWGGLHLYLLYMTHWGVLMLVLETFFSTLICALAYADKIPDASFGLPWYIKTYWVLFNISAPVAFLITIFYWSVLYGSRLDVEYAPTPGLDVSLHGLNSVVMLLELFAGSQPVRAMHVYQPVGFSILYLLFGVFYYLAGGTDPWGNHWIYPVVDWSRPDPTLGVVSATCVALVLLHLLTVGLARARDAMAARLRADSRATGTDNAAFVESS